MTADAPIGIVAGSGIELETLLSEQTAARSFDEIPGLSETAIAGHAGRIVEGRCGVVPIVIQSGRLHFYEGHDAASVTACVDVLHAMGARTILYTNAAGGLAGDMAAGDLMAVTEVACWPYGGWSARPTAAVPTDFVLRACDRRGRYTWVHGPCYETRAEIAALQSLRTDAVGMSTAPELQRCRELGIQAGAVSCITNTCGVPEVLTHARVLETAQHSSERLRGLIRGWLREAPREVHV